MSSIITVTQLNNILSAKIRMEPKFRGIAVKGELSDVGRDRSGHLYFRLRDSESGIKGVMFAQNVPKLRFHPMDGMAVVAYGSIDFYSRDGSCEIKVTQLLPDGAGAGYAALAKLKEKLSALGIFSAPKKPIPRYPKEIAVVTSPTGAAIQDIKNIISRRYPAVKLTLFPTPVQGIDAPAGIVSALRAADMSGADTLILARGGGSAEDLSAFNAEEVVMAVAGCKTPVISAVGHEIDWTLSDLAADLRAPTPSGAAELATPDIAVMKREIEQYGAMLRHYTSQRIKSFSDVLRSYEYLLLSCSPKSKIDEKTRELEVMGDMIKRYSDNKLRLRRVELEGLGGLLESLGPENVISRGYAMVYKHGEPVADIKKLAPGDEIKIIMHGGAAGAEVKSIGDKDEL